MNIIILGAGQVGGTLAETLVKEDNDITVVDVDDSRLRALQSRLDIRTVVGAGSHPNIISTAGGESADMLIAVTSSDETNMVACQVAHTLFQIPKKIARIRSNSYLIHPELFHNKGFHIDLCIYPEQLVTRYVRQLIEYPGALQVLDFAGGKIQLVAIKAEHGDPIIGKTLPGIHECVCNASNQTIPMRIVALFRRNQSVELNSQTIIKQGDEVFLISPSTYTKQILSKLRRMDQPYNRVMIGGGGHIGLRLAALMEQHLSVKVIDKSPRLAERAAGLLKNATVLLGDVCDRELLIDENIEAIDVFCAVTNDDEANIMSCIQAKRLGVRKVMALITRTAYVDLIEGSEVDIAISPQQATIGSILTYLRRGDIINVHSLRRGAAEAIEIVAHGDSKTSKVIGRTLAHIKLPPGTTVGAVARGEQIMIAAPDVTIEAGDHLIVLLADKRYIHDVEKLFQVGISYF